MGLLNSNNNELLEPMIYEDTANTDVILAYFKNVLPKLKNKSVIIMDNATFHKGKQLKELFEKYNHKLVFLPPYSPDLNPIENIWGTLLGMSVLYMKIGVEFSINDINKY